MSHGYRMTPAGGKSDPSQPSVQEMTVKSWINSPSAEDGPASGKLKPGMVRQFVLQARLAEGSYTLSSRATDTAGNVQPEARCENHSGYTNTSWPDHAVKITVA